MNDIRQVKVIFLGDYAVGKTSVINRKVHNDKGQPASTVGVYSHKLQIDVDSSKIQLLVFDTAGDEKYSGTINLAMRGAEIFVFMYCIEEMENGEMNYNCGFDRLKELYKQVKEKEQVGNGYVFVVQNKIDLLKEHNFTEAGQEGKEWCAQNRAAFVQTSANTGEGVDNLFLDIAKSAIKLEKVKDILIVDPNDTEAKKDNECQC